MKEQLHIDFINRLKELGLGNPNSLADILEKYNFFTDEIALLKYKEHLLIINISHKHGLWTYDKK